MAEQLALEVTVSEPTKRCCRCQVRKPLNDFYPSGRYLNSRCKPCANEECRQYSVANRDRRNARLRQWRRRNPEAARLKDRRQKLRRAYGLTLTAAEMLLASNSGLCWICNAQPSRCIDHDHVTGRVRGALCNSCNTFLGRVEANPAILDRMHRYAFDQPCHADVLLEIANERSDHA